VDILAKIKRLVLARRIVFTRKAEDEMYLDNLSEDEVIEAIVRAPRINKTLRSASEYGNGKREKLYIIKGLTFSNVAVYTKGKIHRDSDQETFYILISSKRII
jgi:hypothetical protein